MSKSYVKQMTGSDERGIAVVVFSAGRWDLDER
jgi:hypothetical protein